LAHPDQFDPAPIAFVQPFGRGDVAPPWEIILTGEKFFPHFIECSSRALEKIPAGGTFFQRARRQNLHFD